HFAAAGHSCAGNLRTGLLHVLCHYFLAGNTVDRRFRQADHRIQPVGHQCGWHPDQSAETGASLQPGWIPLVAFHSYRTGISVTCHSVSAYRFFVRRKSQSLADEGFGRAWTGGSAGGVGHWQRTSSPHRLCLQTLAAMPDPRPYRSFLAVAGAAGTAHPVVLFLLRPADEL